jgi:hypothetical protein
VVAPCAVGRGTNGGKAGAVLVCTTAQSGMNRGKRKDEGEVRAGHGAVLRRHGSRGITCRARRSVEDVEGGVSSQGKRVACGWPEEERRMGPAQKRTMPFLNYSKKTSYKLKLIQSKGVLPLIKKFQIKYGF